MSTPQEPPVLNKITQIKNSLDTIINGNYTIEQKDKAQQVLNNITDYESKFQTALDTFSDNIEKQYVHFVASKSLGITKTKTLLNQLCSAISVLANGTFLDDLTYMSADELVDYLDEHLVDILELLVNAINSATTFSSLVNQVNSVLQNLFSAMSFLMSSLNDVENEIRNALDECISYMMYNNNSVNDKFQKLESISNMTHQERINKIKEIANTTFDSETVDISNDALNIIETLS